MKLHNKYFNCHVTIGAMTSLADSEGILETEGCKSSVSLSALSNRTEKKSAKDKICAFCSI